MPKSAVRITNHIELSGSKDYLIFGISYQNSPKTKISKAIEDLMLLVAKAYSASHASSTAFTLESSVAKVLGELEKLDTKHRGFIQSGWQHTFD
jgi:nucleoid-associated protein YejK